MKYKKTLTSLSVAMFLTPILAGAATIGDTIETIGNWISDLIPLVSGIALLYFFWGLAEFILKSGDATAREEGKQKMLWGVIALFVMFSIWGLVFFLIFSFDITPENMLVPPTVQI